LATKDRWEGIRDRGRQFVERERTWAASVARYRPIFDSLAPNPR